jgi:hypothetical protein
MHHDPLKCAYRKVPVPSNKVQYCGKLHRASGAGTVYTVYNRMVRWRGRESETSHWRELGPRRRRLRECPL